MAGAKLAARTIDKKLEPGLYRDSEGLYLQVSAWGTKAWVYRFMMAGRARKMGLGKYPAVGLKDAREKRDAAYRLYVDGVDPIEARNKRKADDALTVAKVSTFKQCAKEFIKAKRAGWKSAKHAAQWEATLDRYAYDLIGGLSVADIDADLVLRVLEQPVAAERGLPAGTLWTARAETASRVRGRIEQVLDWAKVKKRRTGDNPARWTGQLQYALPERSSVAPVENHPALPYAELPTFIEALRKREGTSAQALEFTILTAARTADTIGATWDEIDLKGGFWTVPKERLKGKKGARKRDHIVPLCKRAVALLKALPRDGKYVFPGAKEGKPLSNMAMLELLRGMMPGMTVHGFRSTFKDWCSDATDYPNEMSELALAHTIPDKVEAAYRRSNMIAKRRQMMEHWAAYCDGRDTADNVVTLRRGARK